MNRVVRGGGIALSAVTFMIWTGVTASAETETSDVQDTVQAIDAVAGGVRSDAIDVSKADVTVDASGTSVDLTRNAEDGIAVETPTGANFDIGLPFASAADTAVIVDGAVVYDNNNGSTTTPLVQDDGAVQILTTIADANAPTEYTYVVDAATGGGLVLTEDGGVDVVGPDGFVVSHVTAPWAVDAKGNAVPTHFSIDGNTLTQTIDHGVATAYPVVADPKFTSTWWNKTLYFDRYDTGLIAIGGSIGSAWLAKFPGIPVKVVAGVLEANAALFGLYYYRGGCGKLVWYVGYPAPVPQQYGGSEAGGYCA